MKNKLAIFIFLVICIQMTSQNMYHKQIDLPFNSNSNLRDILGKEFLQKYFLFYNIKSFMTSDANTSPAEEGTNEMLPGI